MLRTLESEKRWEEKDLSRQKTKQNKTKLSAFKKPRERKIQFNDVLQ